MSSVSKFFSKYVDLSYAKELMLVKLIVWLGHIVEYLGELINVIVYNDYDRYIIMILHVCVGLYGTVCGHHCSTMINPNYLSNFVGSI